MSKIQVTILTPDNPYELSVPVVRMSFTRLSDAYVRTSAVRERSVIGKNTRNVWDCRTSPEVYRRNKARWTDPLTVLAHDFGARHVRRISADEYRVTYHGCDYAVVRRDHWVVERPLGSNYVCASIYDTARAIHADASTFDDIII